MNKEVLYITGQKVRPEFIDGLGEVEVTETFVMRCWPLMCEGL
jgi:hypothetical protein